MSISTFFNIDSCYFDYVTWKYDDFFYHYYLLRLVYSNVSQSCDLLNLSLQLGRMMDHSRTLVHVGRMVTFLKNKMRNEIENI